MATQNNDAEAVKFHEIFDKYTITANRFNNYNPEKKQIATHRKQNTVKQV